MIARLGDFHELLDAAPDAMIVVDGHGRVTAVNLEAERFLGWTEKELLGEPMSRLVPPRFHRMLEPDIRFSGQAREATGWTVSCFARLRNESESPVEMTRRSLAESGEGYSLLTLRDLTQWRRAQDPRTQENSRAALESIGDAVITTDATGRITFLNTVAESMTGWDVEDALGQPLDAVLPLISESSRQPVENTVGRCLEEGRAIDLEEGVLLLRRDGTEVPIGDSAAPIHGRSGETIGVVLVIQDESVKRRAGHRLSYEATHDALTGLVNRREFERRLARVLNDLSGSASDQMLLFLDLDRFKVVNDTGGHDAGDELLRSLSAVLSHRLRKRDTLARLGGDEFGILVENCPLIEAERIAEGLRADIEQLRFEWAGQSFSIGASIGLMPLTSGTGGLPAVLRAVDAACYMAKEAGGNRVHVERVPGSAELPQAIARRVTRLARAIDESHFLLYAQPIVPLQEEGPARLHFEVLLRLPDGRGGIQAAADFLPQAERHNLMPAIDRWVVRETIALLGRWRREHLDSELPVCSINLSPATLAEDSLLIILEQQLAKHAIPSETICFEIAETAAFGNLARTVRFLSGIRTTGCGVALEDVGTGVTSFSYLKTLPVDYLKIGGHFVRGIVEDPIYGSIVGAVHQIGRSMGISTIAKQAGSAAVVTKLRSLGIGYAQGHALIPPMPLTDADGHMRMENLRRSA